MRNLDHFVMPVADLASARARFTALGFTVANDANHPFGTQNCCVFFGDGTFIEPLAVGSRQAYDAAIAASHSFVSGHYNYTNKNGPEGFSHLVVSSKDARADHVEFCKFGMSGGDIVDFGRTFTKADGSTGEVAFSLAFAKEPLADHASFFACEIVKSVPGGRGALVNHANGVLRTKQVIASADNPKLFGTFFETLLRIGLSESQNAISCATLTGMLSVLSSSQLAEEFGLIVEDQAQLQLQALVLQVASLATIRELLAKNNISVHEINNRIIVPPASGQGGTIIFEE
jgi:catechol 2,3-dioxygenase-like lactoylglutathione lyase family enzyme